MAKFGVITLAFALAPAAGAAAAEAPVTLVVEPRIVGVGGGVIQVSGNLPVAREGEEVVLEAKECGAPSFVPYRKEHTDARGAFHTSVAPGIRTSYRARWRDSRSAVVEVLARPTIRFEQEGRTRYSVWMFAFRFFAGAKGRMERFDRPRGRWVLVRRVTLGRRSAPKGASFAYSGAEWSARVPVGALIRFVLPRDQTGPCYLAGYSAQLNAQ